MFPPAVFSYPFAIRGFACYPIISTSRDLWNDHLMEDWELFLRKQIFSDYLRDRRSDADEKMNELILRKNGGKFYRYRPIDDAEVELIRNGNLYLCRAIRFDGNGDGYVRFKSYLSCFTDDVKSIPMWFDYADQGRGMCLEYTYEHIKQFAEANKLIFLPVMYDDEETVFSGKLGSLLSMMTKSTDKAGEYEWRLWKVDMKSSDIGKIMSSINPVRIHIGENADTSTGTFDELMRVAEMKGIEVEQSAKTVFF